MKEKIPRPIKLTITVNGNARLEDLDDHSLAKGLAEAAQLAMKDWRDILASRGGALPGEFTDWDISAWQRLEAQVGQCQCDTEINPNHHCPLSDWMLMHHESDQVAAFKNRNTRKYIRV